MVLGRGSFSAIWVSISNVGSARSEGAGIAASPNQGKCWIFRSGANSRWKVVYQREDDSFNGDTFHEAFVDIFSQHRIFSWVTLGV